MSELKVIDMCEKHEVRFYKGRCDICQIIDAAELALTYLEDGAAHSAQRVLSDMLADVIPEPTQFDPSDGV